MSKPKKRMDVPEDATLVVVFRKFTAGSVVALFPEIAGDSPGSCMGYSSTSGHSTGFFCSVMARTDPATPEQYEALKAELEGKPYHYKLDVQPHWQPKRSDYVVMLESLLRRLTMDPADADAREQAVKLLKVELPPDDPREEEARELAKEEYEEAGVIEFDGDEPVSFGEDGAYVRAWVFVEKDKFQDYTAE